MSPASSSTEIVSGLASLADRYDVLFCDVWGVLHDGIASFPNANEALTRFRRNGGRVVLLTNAPRPESSVAAQLAEFGTDPGAYDAIVTSGDVTRAAIIERGGQRMFRIGPDRDLGLFDGLDACPSSLEDAEFVVCTGLVDDDLESVADYTGTLETMRRADLPMICANPDLVVERGNRLVPCAGALAAAYEAMGGQVYTGGKPHRPIYEAGLARAAELLGRVPDKSRVLAIGDAIRTDVAGGRHFGLDVLMIGRGIHADELELGDQLSDPGRALAWLGEQPVRPTALASTLVW